eukprot:1155102-Pelagomonas_calceolata.AAC.8
MSQLQKPDVHATPCRTESGTQQSTHLLLNNKVWLAQWGVSHWGQRVKVDGWEAYDCVRGANIFGSAQLTNALIDGRSDNVWARWVSTAPYLGKQLNIRCNAGTLAVLQTLPPLQANRELEVCNLTARPQTF